MKPFARQLLMAQKQPLRADFTQGVPASATFTRSETSSRYTPSRSLEFIEANRPRFDYDPNNAQPLGLRIEGARQNYVRNATCTGGTVGVVGSGGVLPTNFQTNNSSSGATITVGAATVNGVQGFTVQYQGMYLSNGAYFLSMESADSTNPAVAAISEVWTAAFFLSVTVGDPTVFSSIKVGMMERTAGGTFVAQNGTSQNRPALAAGGMFRGTYTRTLTGATTARVAPVLILEGLSGTSFNVTFFIGLPNIFKASAASSAANTVNAIPAEVMTGPLGTISSGVLYASGYAPVGSSASVLCQLDDGTANNRVTIRRTATFDVYATVVAGGVTVADLLLGRWAAGVYSSVVVTWGGSISACAGGGLPVTQAAAGPASLTTWRAGSDISGNYWGGTISQMTVSRSDSLDQASRTAPLAIHDDFIRPDSALTGLPGGRYAYTFVPYTVPTSAVRVPSIVSNKLVCASAAGESASGVTAAYTGVDFGKVPYRLVTRATFDAGVVDRGNVTLISNANGNSLVAQITAGSVHVTFTDANCNVSYFDTTVLTTVATLAYSVACTKDGATVYQFGWRYIGGNFFIIEQPTGAEIPIYSAEMAAKLGRYLTYEHYWESDGPRPTIYEIYGA